MDKVRQILGVLKKHHFWIVSVMVSAAILGCWYSARASLSQKYQTEKSGIDNIFNNLQTISSNAEHPNPSFKTGVELEKEKLKKTTDAEWQQLYDRQKAVFVWPEALPKFKEWEAESPKKPMSLEMRQQYQAFIDSEFPKLEALVNVRREKNPTGTTTPGMISPTMMRQPSFPMTGVTPGAEMIGVIDWEPADFMRMKSNLKTWNTTTPTQREVELCHESLAIYRSLLEAIAKVNVAATDNENAIVKKIIALDIGKDASVPGTYDVSNVIMPSELAPGSGTEGAASGYPSGPPMTGAPETATGVEVNKDAILLDQRYLDGAGAPVAQDAILTSPPFAEFKLMKVRLLLVVQQQGIPVILAELANAKLGVEVHQVRVNPQNSTVVQSVRTLLTSVGGAPGGSMPGTGREGGGVTQRPTMMTRPPAGVTGRPSGGSFGGRREGGSMMPSMASANGAENPNDATVEIKGIIYIYNPYNETKTGSGNDTTNVDQRTMFGFAGASGAAGGAPAAAPTF